MMTDERRAMLLGLSLSHLVELVGVTETSVARLIEERDALKASVDDYEAIKTAVGTNSDYAITTPDDGRFVWFASNGWATDATPSLRYPTFAEALAALRQEAAK